MTNPFEPPRAESPVPIGVIRPLDAWATAWQAMVAAPVEALLMPLVLFLLAAVGGLMALLVGVFITLSMAAVGYLRMALTLTDPAGLPDRQAAARQLVSGFFQWRTALRLLLVTILTDLPDTIADIANEVSPGHAAEDALVALSLAFVPFKLRWSLAIFYVADQDCGVGASLTHSWRATRGQWLPLLAVHALFIPAGLLGLLALVVGIWPASTLYQFALAATYHQTRRVDHPPPWP